MQKIIILNFGSQTTQLIGRRVRELNTFCEVLPYDKFPADDPDVIGVILSGSPLSVYDPEAFHPDLSAIIGRYPVLGICYGCQLIAWMENGVVSTAPVSEYGKIELTVGKSALFDNIPEKSIVWMSHTDYISSAPEGYEVIATTPDCPCAAMQNT